MIGIAGGPAGAGAPGWPGRIGAAVPPPGPGRGSRVVAGAPGRGITSGTSTASSGPGDSSDPGRSSRVGAAGDSSGPNWARATFGSARAGAGVGAWRTTAAPPRGVSGVGRLAVAAGRAG